MVFLLLQFCGVRTVRLPFKNLSCGQILDGRREFVCDFFKRQRGKKALTNLSHRTPPDTPIKKPCLRHGFFVASILRGENPINKKTPAFSRRFFVGFNKGDGLDFFIKICAASALIGCRPTGALPLAFRLWSNSLLRAFEPSPHQQKNTGIQPAFFCWRKGGDSNSRRTRALDGFQDRCIKPLCHLSILHIYLIIISVNEKRYPYNLKKITRQEKNRNAMFFYICEQARIKQLPFVAKCARLSAVCNHLGGVLCNKKLLK